LFLQWVDRDSCGKTKSGRGLDQEFGINRLAAFNRIFLNSFETVFHSPRLNPRLLNLNYSHPSRRLRTSVGLIIIATASLVTATAASEVKAAEQFSWPAFLGPFHMVVLHYPIGFLTLTVLLELSAMLKPGGGARRAVAFALPITTAMALITAGLGWMRAGNGEFDPQLLGWHRVCGFAVLGFTFFAWLLHWKYHRSAKVPAFRYGYRGLLLAAFLSMALAGHFGGSLTHGSGFLTLNAPTFIKKLLPGLVKDVPVATTAAGESIYAKVVQPAFAKKCYSCHGPDKQKGKFRLDLREFALKGGESGDLNIVPEDLAKSRLIYHLLLPREHDDAMPPKGKEALTPEEIVAVAQWIQAGAKFD
jgi:mono/diheme cytochrome c family protein/uncharacterized membrane protein